MCDGRNTIILVGVILPDAVKVHAGAVVLRGVQVVGEMDDHIVTPVGEQCGSRDAAVDGHGTVTVG